MIDDWNMWKITPEDRCKHDERFQALRPIDGFITGEQARTFFTQSELPTPLLAKIWALADLTADGKLDRREFSIAMFLIKKCIEGNNLPPQLPPSLLQEPHQLVASVLPDSLFSSAARNSANNGGSAIDSNEWSISAALRPKYKLYFNQNDHNKRGYLTGAEARDIFVKSKLPQPKLAAIWHLADVDRDGNLTCEEFCIAAYLIDQVLGGRALPPTLPSTLMPSFLTQRGDRPKSASIGGEQREDTESRMTFEDKRMQNFCLGQAELEKRKQSLMANLKQEDEIRREKTRVESEKQEMERLERERERQRQAEIEAERARAMEARRQEAANVNLQRMRLFPANSVPKNQSNAELPTTNGSTAKSSAFTIPATQKIAATVEAPTLVTAIQSKPKKEEEAGTESVVITPSETPELALVVTPFAAQSSEQLSLSVDQYVKIRKRSAKGWWEGEIQQRGQDRQVGWFPAEYVRLINANDSTTEKARSIASTDSASTPVIMVSSVDTVAAAPIPFKVRVESTDSGPSTASVAQTAAATTPKASTTLSTNLASTSLVQAIFAYKACQPDELTFPEGELIEVLVHEEEGWWRGRIQSTGVEGLFPVNYIKPLQSDDSSDATTTTEPSSTAVAAAMKPYARRGGNSGHGKDSAGTQDSHSTRQHTILEIIDSECQYLNDLVEVREKFYNGLKKQNVSEKKIAQIFGNWTTLCDIAEAFNKDFQERKPHLKKGKSESIGDILVRHLPKCTVYREYCANQDEALVNLQKLCDEDPNIALFLRACENFMRVPSMPLSSYLIKPMQRITKYKLLIGKVLKYTPLNHPDHGNLNQSFTLASTVLSVCDEAIRNREQFAQFQWLQDHLIFENDIVGSRICGDDDKRLADTEIEVEGERRRRRLLLSGTLFKVKSRKELTAFLFTDMLLITQPINYSASDTTSGNFTLPLKPDASMAKVTFKAYRRPISLDKIRLKTTSSASPKRHRRANSALNKIGRPKRHAPANPTSLNATSSDVPKGLETTTFVILDESDPYLQLIFRSPTEELKKEIMEGIRKAAKDFIRYTDSLKNNLLSKTDKGALFAAIVNLNVISASDLPMVGPNGDELPWPYCEVSACLRSKRTSVILSTRSPKWNCALSFPVKDLTQDVVTIYVYSKSANSTTELLGMAEVRMPEVVKHCRRDSSWKTVLPLSSTSRDARLATVTVNFSVTKKGSGLAGEDL